MKHKILIPMTIDTEKLPDYKFKELFPETWDIVCASVAERCGVKLADLRKEAAKNGQS